jgi:hypothetical protein
MKTRDSNRPAAMNIFTSLRFSACLLGFAVFAVSTKAKSQTISCDGIAGDVSTAVQKDPSKVLMIVEDALVINDTCACEIIKAAIAASAADAALINQIVQTGISVAPKMSGVIMDCANGMSPNAVSAAQVTATASAKDVKNPLPISPPPAEEEFVSLPSVRPFLIQPPAGGFPPRGRDKTPISPSNAVPNFP